MQAPKGAEPRVWSPQDRLLARRLRAVLVRLDDRRSGSITRVEAAVGASPQTSCRVAVRDDLDVILGLYEQLHPADAPPTTPDVSRTFDVIERSEWLHLYVLEHGGTVVATAYLNVVPNLTRGTAPYGVIENVVVDEAYRNRGLGQALMSWTLGQAWALGCYKVMLMTGSRRDSTHQFYRSCGFASDEKTGYLARRP
jgi:GNAT superfamily N-acetyltransferase